jgi:hypothetical protein
VTGPTMTKESSAARHPPHSRQSTGSVSAGGESNVSGMRDGYASSMPSCINVGMAILIDIYAAAAARDGATAAQPVLRTDRMWQFPGSAPP